MTNRKSLVLGLLLAAATIVGGLIWKFAGQNGGANPSRPNATGTHENGNRNDPPIGERAPPSADGAADTIVAFRPEPVTLAPRVHLLGRMPYGVAYAVEGSDGWALVDTGLADDAAGTLDQIRELGLDVKKLRAILLTHAHGDHTMGARRLRELSGAKVYAGPGDADVLRAGGPREALFSTYAMDQIALHATPVDVTLADNDTVELGDTTITAVATPGHTPGSMCYVRTRGGPGVLFSGDTISSLQDDIGTYAVMLPPRFRGDARQYLASLRKLRALSPPDLVCPGHPNESRVRHGPRVTREQWFALLDRGIRETEEVVRRYDADGADFLDGEPKQLLDGLYYLGDRRSGTIDARPTYALRTRRGFVLFDAPGEEGLSEFVEQALAKLGVASPSFQAVIVTSRETASVAGLAEFVRQTSCEVVAPEILADRLRTACPRETRFVTPEQWAAGAEVELETVTLDDAGSPSASYVLNWGERRVLVSGTLPIALSPRSTERLRANLGSRLTDAAAARETVKKLREARPQVWLPTEASFGQNANLYANQWEAIVAGNLQLIGQYLPPEE